MSSAETVEQPVTRGKHTVSPARPGAGSRIRSLDGPSDPLGTAPPRSPWLRGVLTIATYAQSSEAEVGEALRTGELRGHQKTRNGKTVPGSTWRAHIDDIDAWIRGEPPPPRRVPAVTRGRSK